MKGLPCQILKLEELESKDDQRKFLTTAHKNGLDIAKAYQCSKLSFHSPIHLALFSYFYSLDQDAVKSWTSPAHLMRGIIEYGRKDLATRLHHAGLKDSACVSGIILANIALISFCNLLTGNEFLVNADADWIVNQIKEQCNCPKVSHIDCLSSFFPCIGSGYFDSTSNSINFLHKSHKEVFGAFYVFQQMKAGKNILDICDNALKCYENIGKAKENEDADEKRVEKENKPMEKIQKEKKGKEEEKREKQQKRELRKHAGGNKDGKTAITEMLPR